MEILEVIFSLFELFDAFGWVLEGLFSLFDHLTSRKQEIIPITTLPIVSTALLAGYRGVERLPIKEDEKSKCCVELSKG